MQGGLPLVGGPTLAGQGVAVAYVTVMYVTGATLALEALFALLTRAK